MAELEYLTEQEQKEWMRGYPYSMAFTQGVVHSLADLQAQLQQAQDERKLYWEAYQRAVVVVRALRGCRNAARAERDVAIKRGERLWLLASIHQSDHRWWIRTCEYWQRQADAARTDGAMSAARDDFWNVLAKLDERAVAAEALLEAAWLQSGHPHFQTWYENLTPAQRGEGDA